MMDVMFGRYKNNLFFIFLIISIFNCNKSNESSSKGNDADEHFTRLSTLSFSYNITGHTYCTSANEGPSREHKGSISSFAVADFNNDNFQELIIGGPTWRFKCSDGSGYENFDDNISVQFESFSIKNGIISNNTSDLLTGTPSAMHAREGTAADVNGDGIKDFISANHGEDQGHNREANTLLLSNTNGKLVNSTNKIPTTVGYYHSLPTGDIDNDNDLDVLVGSIHFTGNQGPGAVILQNNNGALDNTSILPEEARTSAATSWHIADLDNDGWNDLILGANCKPCNDNDSTKIYWNNSGQFSHSTDNYTILSEGLLGNKVAVMEIVGIDYNKDNYKDLIIIQNNRNDNESDPQKWELILFKNNGNKQFTNITIQNIKKMNFTQGNPIKIYITDLDEDQDDDIFLIYCGLDQTDYDGSADVWLKNEDGIFTLIDSDTFLKWNSSNQRSQCLIPVDVDSDGDMDIIEIVGNTDLGYKLTLQRNNKN